MFLLKNAYRAPTWAGGAVSMPVCAKMERNGPAGTNLSTLSQNSCYVHSTPCLNSPTSDW